MRAERLSLARRALVLLVVSAAPALAQDEEIRRHGIFIDSLEVSLVNVEVHVTLDGEPVTDLSKDDFEILDDGQPVEITNFFRVEGGRRVAGPTSGTMVGAAADAAAIVEPSAVIVLVDQPFISPLSRKVVFDRLGERLGGLLREGTRVMVVAKDRALDVVQPLTSDPHLVRAALDRLATASGSTYAAEVRSAIQAIETAQTAVASRQSGPGGSPSLATAESDARAAYRVASGHSAEVHARALSSFALLNNLVGSLAGLPGRKAVLYVADRVPVRSGELVWRVWYERYGRDWGAKLGVPSVAAATREYDASRVVQDLLADANANRVAFYPIGAGADAGPDLFSAESRGLATPSRYFTRADESDEGLRWLARGTGGRAAIGRGDVDRFFEGMHQDLTHYYSLAYASPHRGDGEAHEIEVRVRRQEEPEAGERLEVRYLSEYRDKSSDQQVADRTLASLVLGASDNPLGVRVEAGGARKQSKGRFTVPLKIRIPVANLVLFPDTRSHLGKLSIQLVVRDEAGRFSDPVKIPLPIEIPHGSMSRVLTESAVYETELTLRRGRQTIAVGVSDEYAAITSAINVELDVGR